MLWHERLLRSSSWAEIREKKMPSTSRHLNHGIHSILSLTLFLIATLFLSISAHADIFRWDNNQLVPGTAGITPGPGINLSNWNTLSHNLEFANLGFNLTGASFANTDLSFALFPSTSAILTNVSFSNAVIAGANFGRNDCPR